MNEKILKTKSNGFAALFSILLLLILSVVGFISSIALIKNEGLQVVCILLSILVFISSLILFGGLKVVKPQEAIVLTLFGEYTGSIKEPGFYFVNPFSVSVNPAAKTKLGQSGDVDRQSTPVTISTTGVEANLDALKKQISLKIMTLNNSRQKINDCLGNPVEIGIAVTWRVVDTAKAVFNVDNYKEYLSLQCDSELRNIVRIYPYDVAPNVDTTGDGVADEGSLRGSSEVVAKRIRDEIQARVENAGLEIIEATYHLPCLRSRNRCSNASTSTSFCNY